MDNPNTNRNPNTSLIRETKSIDKLMIRNLTPVLALTQPLARANQNFSSVGLGLVLALGSLSLILPKLFVYLGFMLGLGKAILSILYGLIFRGETRVLIGVGMNIRVLPDEFLFKSVVF